MKNTVVIEFSLRVEGYPGGQVCRKERVSWQVSTSNWRLRSGKRHHFIFFR